MFVDAIERAAAFTRPLHTIARNFGSQLIQPGAATIILVNPEGWALTCRHVADLTAAAHQLSGRRTAFRNEVATAINKQQKKQIAKKHGFGPNQTYDLQNLFVGCVDAFTGFEVIPHGTLDVALIRFDGFQKVLCSTFPVFASNGSELKQGKALCRLGFPFAEFTNFELDAANDGIRWTNTGLQGTPRFPLDGMLTRHLADNNGNVVAFEMSTPGLRGQSGGPVFDRQGIVWGMQSATAHLDLDFDVDVEVVRMGSKKRVHDSAFLHVGHCVHVDVLKAFMHQNGVKFQEG